MTSSEGLSEPPVSAVEQAELQSAAIDEPFSDAVPPQSSLADGSVQPCCPADAVADMEANKPQIYTRLVGYSPRINQQLARYGVKFGLYKNGQFEERLFPFDAIPRVISAE